MTELQTNGESSMNKDNFDSEALEAPETMTMRLCGDLYAQDYGEFEMPIGAEIKEVHGKWGRYIISFKDPEKYLDRAVNVNKR